MSGLVRIWALVGMLTVLSGGALRAQDGVGDARLILFGGPAFLTGGPPEPMQLGIGGEAALFHAGSRSLIAGPQAEGGIFHPAISGKGNYYVSTDVRMGDGTAEGAGSERKLRGFAVAGYTRFFNATDGGVIPANAVNFGVGVDRWLSEGLWLRVELREHYTPAGDAHALVLRIGLAGGWSMR